jgi:four helix bundle protein
MAPWRQSYEDGQDIRDRVFEFACCVVEYCERLYDAGGLGRLMTAQLLNCSTSVPAMLEEARAAESKRDFISTAIIRNTRRNAELKTTTQNGRKTARIPNS